MSILSVRKTDLLFFYFYKMEVIFIKDFWTKEEDDILLNAMYVHKWKTIYEMLNHKRTLDSIKTRARRLGYSNDTVWTNEEVNIIKKYYCVKTVDEVYEMLKRKRNRDSIIMFASKIGVKSPVGKDYSVDDDNIIIENFKTKTDFEISKMLSRTQKAIKARRHYLGLYRMNKKEKNYSRLGDFLRRNTVSWRDASMISCDYKCVITGGKDFQVHHITPVNVIIDMCFEKLKINKMRSFSDYKDEELRAILDLFSEIQNTELGICIDKDLHSEFHYKYGYLTNREQICEFIKNKKQQNIK